MRDYQTKANAGGLPDTISTTRFGAGEFNSIAQENESAVSSSGQTLAPADGTAETLDQLAMALAIYGAGGAGYHIDTGAADAYVLDPVALRKSPPAYFDGFEITFEPGNVNTGASTVNVNGIGVKDIKIDASTPLTGGELTGRVTIYYNASAGIFQLEVTSDGSPITTRGDVIVGSAAGGGIRLPVGAVDQVLQSNGTDVVWGASPAPGWTFINTLNIPGFNGAAFSSTPAQTTIDIPALTAGAIPADAQALMLFCGARDSGSSSGNAVVQIFNDDGENQAIMGVGNLNVGAPNNGWVWSNATVRCTAGKLSYVCVATGSNTLDIQIDILGYYR